MADRRIAVIAQKGGVGKTTVTANLGAALATLGHRVLLVDCDPQGSLAAALGQEATKPGLGEVLAGTATAVEAVRPTAVTGLDLLPADLSVTDAEFELFARPQWYHTLRRALDPLDGYDLVLIDTPPGLGVLSFVALLAGEGAVALCPPEFLAHRALGQVLATIERAQKLSPGLRLLGIAPTLVSRRSRHERQVLERLAAEHGPLLLPEVPRRVAYQEAARMGTPVTARDPEGEAAVVFLNLALAVLARLDERSGNEV